MKVCPKCNAFSADGSLAFCRADGTPLIGVDLDSDAWREGSRIIKQKEGALKKRTLIRKWRLVVMSVVTGLIATMVMSISMTVETTYSISGSVMDATKPVAGATMLLAGTKTASKTTDVNGLYKFEDLPAGGSYTITPPATTMTFAPDSRTVSPLAQNESADFIRLIPPQFYTISGQVMSEEKALGGVKIMLQGAGGTMRTETNTQGYYFFNDRPAGGDYTITAARPNMTFTPGTHTVPQLSQNHSANFTGIVDVFEISVNVIYQERGLADVSLTLKGATTVVRKTDRQGHYIFSDLPAGRKYTITPGIKGVIFSPRSIAKLTKDEVLDFIGQPAFFTISGKVSFRERGLEGISITLEGLRPDVRKTDGDGRYSFSNLPAGGKYTVSAMIPGAGISVRPIEKLIGHEVINFTALAPHGPAGTPTPVRAPTRTPTPRPGRPGILNLNRPR